MTTQEKLISIYEQAEKRLFAIIQRKGAFASAAVYERSLLQQIQKELNKLKASSAKTVDELVIENYQSSLNELIEDLKKIGAPIDMDITPAQLAMSKLNTRQIEMIARNVSSDFNKAVNMIGRRTQDMIRTVTLEATAQKLSTGQTIKQMQKSLTEIFKAQNIMSVPYKNGASMPIRKYAEMTARSTTAETQNTAKTVQGAEWGYDLVKMTTHSPTCELCAMYQGRVYATTREAAEGKYKLNGKVLKFPYLYETAFAKGYSTLHPNCRHRISIFPIRAYTDEEILKHHARSNEPFEDSRSDKERKAYAEEQAAKRRKNENYKQYERIKAALPNDAPKSFAGFIRMKQANSQRYQELMSDYRYITRVVKMSDTSTTKMNDWSNALPQEHTKEERAYLLEYAKNHNVKIHNIKDFDGSADMLKEQIDTIDAIRTEYKIKPKITVRFAKDMSDDDFAFTINNTIHFNNKALRNRQITEENLKGDDLVSEKSFGISVHEMGHIITKNYGEKGIEIAKRAYYNIYNKSLNTFGIIEYLKNNVSKYSVDVDKFDENTGLPKRVTDKDYIEIIPEMLAKSKVSNDRFTDEFIKLLKEMIV